MEEAFKDLEDSEDSMEDFPTGDMPQDLRETGLGRRRHKTDRDSAWF